ncbi:thiopeptide-type bacteriocin biosynthesis protein [Parafrankia sp. FMc2]|uniref:thiopeptide-type bacteriocin biosynthesis protein n=1 Tax=Parafrankia sp. FMc2 TaxID=3233196 RepID=UPI0034D46C79
MPADPLTAAGTEQAVLAVLAGMPLPTAAAHAAMHPDHLADAVATYQAAGRATITDQAAACFQVRVTFPDPADSETAAATHLLPVLRRTQASGVAGSWWFVRKTPDWRLRLSPASGTSVADLRAALRPAFDGLTAAGAIRAWAEGIYEPEEYALGGEVGAEVAHRLFAADSGHILGRLHTEITSRTPPRLGRRELSVLLIVTLLRAAGLDWYERGDVFDRVSHLRPPPATAPTTTEVRTLAAALRRLLTADTDPAGDLFGSDRPLANLGTWASAFHDAGRALGQAAYAGTLRRGLRDLLAHHVIFHWNRLGLSAETQGVLAVTARETVLRAPALPEALTPQAR